MTVASPIQSNHNRLICEPQEENFLSLYPAAVAEQDFAECSKPLDEKDFQEYQHLIKTDYHAPSETKFKKPKTKTTGDDIALATIILGGGFLLGGPVGLGAGALLLSGCYSTEKIEVDYGTWIATSTDGAPSGRTEHTAVWTGSEMIVWGGCVINNDLCPSNTGGRYNPVEDRWTPISTDDAPSARTQHTAVWTGSEMIVWGGHGDRSKGTVGNLNTGGRYNPVEDRWTPTSTESAPSGRYNCTAVWTGSKMIEWGGFADYGIGNVDYLNTGGQYNPVRDNWISTSANGATLRPDTYTSIWTGSEMIVWGGPPADDYSQSGTGIRCNPDETSWIPTSMVDAPSARWRHTSIWTGSEMIVWGGVEGNEHLNTGGRYNPVKDSWIPTSTDGAPSVINQHTTVWTGSEMIVWDNPDVGAGRYDPVEDSWTPINTNNAPSGRTDHTAVWTGSEMIIWGGVHLGRDSSYPPLNTGARYRP